MRIDLVSNPTTLDLRQQQGGPLPPHRNLFPSAELNLSRIFLFSRYDVCFSISHSLRIYQWHWDLQGLPLLKMKMLMSFLLVFLLMEFTLWLCNKCLNANILCM
ncbi:hypothetical protein HanIR_Chr17g0896491 [Helianthus annuus]|nr:hypothetical protein HanIR_Chr17g0896491 [Helianthus annuus]